MKVTESVEKMRVKERFINSQHDALREEYQQVSAGWRTRRQCIAPWRAMRWLLKGVWFVDLELFNEDTLLKLCRW